MFGDIKKHFNHDNNPYTNKQLIGCKDLFGGVIVKEWVVSNQKRIDFKLYNKVIVKICIEYFHECCKRRCIVLHELEVQRKFSQDELLEIEEE